MRTTANAPAMSGSLGCALRRLAVGPRPGMFAIEQLAEHMRPLSARNLYAWCGSAVV